jgi:antitoxin VapB
MYLLIVDMPTAKLFRHGGSQAVRLPKMFRFEGSEVEIEKRGDEIILKAIQKPRFKTLGDVAKYMREKYPHGADFPEIERPTQQQERDLNLE